MAKTKKLRRAGSSSGRKKDLAKKVMREIKERHLKMKPKVYFIFGSLLLGIGVAGVVSLSAFFVNLIVFRLRIHKPFAFLVLGWPGLRGFILSFPWLPLVIAVAGLYGSSILLRKYEFSYKRSFISLIIALTALVLTLGFIVSKTGINQRMRRRRFLRRLYQNRLSEKEKEFLREKIKERKRSFPKHK